MGLGDRILNRFEEIGKAERDEAEVEPIIEKSKGDSIRPNNLLKALDSETVPFDLLDDEEQPHYFLRGSSVDIEGDGAGGESITGWDRDRRIGGAFTILTEQRILIIANHPRGYDEHTLPYDSVTSINLNKGIFSKRLSLQTRGATYHLSVTNSDDDEVQEAVEYLRQRRRQGDEPDSTEDSLDSLEKLKSLYDDGAITEEEFKEKKAELLDNI